MAVIALHCAIDEQELAQLICIAIRLAFVIGLYAELRDDSQLPGITTMVVRLKWEGQAKKLVRMFPRVSQYLSATINPIHSLRHTDPTLQIENTNSLWHYRRIYLPLPIPSRLV